MIFTSTSLDGWAAFSYAAEDQDAPASTEEQMVEANNMEEPVEEDVDLAEMEEDPYIDAESDEFDVVEGENPVTDEAEVVHKTLKADKVRLEGMMPEDAKATATDASKTKEVKKLASEDETTLAAYDITIEADGAEYQPDAENPILVQISNKAIKEDKELTIWHIKDNGKKEQIKEFEVSEGKVIFEATGFSVYAIVEGPAPFSPTDPRTVQDLTELAANYDDPQTGGQGFYISYFDKNKVVHYTTNTLNNNGAFVETASIADAAKWYLESAGSENMYYIYTYLGDSTDPYYMKQMANTGSNANKMQLSTSMTAATKFVLSQAESGKFYFKIQNDNRWFQHSNGGTGMRLYTDNNDLYNAKLILTYAVSAAVTEDPYKDYLENNTFGLMVYNGGNNGKALMAEENGTVSGKTALKAQLSLVMADSDNDKVFAPVNTDMSMWSFEWSGNNDYYYIQSDGQYLQLTANGLSLTDSRDNATEIQFVPGSGGHAGEICLKTSQATLTYSGNTNDGFSVGGVTGSEWLKLVKITEDHDNYFRTYSASKVSVSAVENGAHIIIYTRVWDQANSEYKFYAVDGAGGLTQCFESGDSIQWLGRQTNTLLWDFTEHYWEGTTNPNQYYDFYNEASQTYLAPQVTGGQLVSNDPLGVNLNGRTKGYYQTPIVAWDEGNYAYAGLKVDLENMTLVSCPISEASDFYFAIMEELPLTDELSTVQTVNHEQYGITMKITDYDATSRLIKDNPMSAFLGSEKGGAGEPPTQGLLSSDLGDDGYPVAAGGSLKTLLTEGKYSQRQVNHLFIESTYRGTGYYEFDSTQNYAYLTDENTFRVYKELGSYDDNNPRPTLQHGQFLPFNDIKAGEFATKNKYNEYDALANPLSDSDPRKNESLYLAQGKTNLYFAVEIEASFTQTPSGQDDWGHDIIYEFTGDDDFWLYVDGELVIDLGGVHSALPGSVNYATGDVSVNGVDTTLRNIFEEHYRAQHSGATEQEVKEYLDGIFEENTSVFKEYTNHTMRIFYMERGGGASNLHMRFNLASVKPGTVELTKKLSGVDNNETVLAEFPFQIFYKDSEGHEQQLASSTAVMYKGTVNKVPFKDRLSVPGVTDPYHNVYMLKPGETAVIDLPEEAKSYRIVECGVNSNVYHQVKVNGVDVEGTGSHRKDYGTQYAETSSRPRVTFENIIRQNALRTLTITKRLFNFDGRTPVHHADDDSVFSFRLSLCTEFDEQLEPTNMFAYHVKDEHGYYCKWDSTGEKFASLGKTSYADLTDAEKKSATFHTSIRGSIGNIPVDYSVEVRGLLAGTQFKVTERPSEIPDGYLFQKYVYNNVELTDAEEGVTDIVEDHTDSAITVENKKVWALRVNKTWSDAEYMADRDPAYFAIYTVDEDTHELELVPGSVRRMAYGAKDTQTLYWYYETNLPVDHTTFSQYVIREVTVVNPSVNSDTGVVTYDSVTPVDQGESIEYEGTPVEGTSGVYTYSVDYKNENTGKDHVKRVKVTNNRNDSPIVLKKTDMEGNPLEGVVFTRENNNTHRVFTHTSDEDGIITNAYLQEGVTYTLTETKAKKGYQAPEHTIKIIVNNGTVTVTTGDPDMYELEQKTPKKPATLTIKNKPFTLTVLKQDRSTSPVPLSGAVFELYYQVTTGGVTDFKPMPGYDNLETGADGKVSVNDLPAGVYQLRETTAPSGYDKYSETNAPIFRISDTGIITLDRPDPGYLTEAVTDSAVNYTLTVKDDGMTVAPTGYTSKLWPLIWMLLLGLFLGAAMMYMRKRRSQQ